MIEQRSDELVELAAQLAELARRHVETTGEQLLSFAQTLSADGAVGGSIYDWATLSEANRSLLDRLFADYPEVPG